MSERDDELLQRMARVETLVDSLVGEVRELRENHLAHLKKDIENLGEKISGRPSWSVMLIISGLAAAVGILLPLVLQK